jgi:glutamate/tyrosine decarboxylase-like PLP-dependent enzyme
VFERPAPEDGMGEVAFDALTEIAEHARAGNGRLFAYVVGSGEPVGALGDLYASVLLAPVDLSAVCFRWTGGPAATLDERNKQILQRVVRRGRVLLSNATLRGQFALRACIVNHRTTDEGIAAVIEEVLAAAQEMA